MKITNINNSTSSLYYKWFSIVAIVNDIVLTKRELQLLSFIAVNRDISSGGKKEEFIKQYDSSVATTNNLISTLFKKGFLDKVNGKILITNKLHIIPSQLEDIHVILKG